MFTLGRKIDFSYQTNKIISALALLFIALGWFASKDIMVGVNIGGAVFLTWALARELDPKYAYSAFLSVAFSLVYLLNYQSVQFLLIFWIILVMRLLSGICGKKTTLVDILSVFGLTLYLSINNQNSIYLIPFIITMLLLVLFKENSKQAIILSAVTMGIFIVESISFSYLSLNVTTYSSLINIALLSLVIISMSFWLFTPLGEIDDDLGKSAKAQRVIASKLMYSLILLLLYFFGDLNHSNLIIISSVLLAVIVYWLLDEMVVYIKRK